MNFVNCINLDRSGTTSIRQNTVFCFCSVTSEWVELLCEEIEVINKGKVIANDTKTNLLKILEEKEVKVEFSNKVKNLPKKIKDFCILKDHQSATLKFNKNEINTAELIKEFINSKIDLKDITTKESDLEDIFIKLLKN